MTVGPITDQQAIGAIGENGSRGADESTGDSVLEERCQVFVGSFVFAFVGPHGVVPGLRATEGDGKGPLVCRLDTLSQDQEQALLCPVANRPSARASIGRKRCPSRGIPKSG